MATSFQCSGKALECRSVDLLLQLLKDGRCEKFRDGDAEPVTELFDRYDGDVPAAFVHHAVDGGGGYARLGRQLVVFDPAFPAQVLEAADDGLFYVQKQFASRKG